MDETPRTVLPEPSYGGQYPTLNQRGFMSPTLDEFNERFVELAAAARGVVVDLGCAYGLVTLAALARGATVLAVDMEQGHLDAVEALCPPEDRDRLRTRVGVMPGLALEPGSIDAVHTARMLHFLDPEDVDASLREIHGWLRPGGTLVVTVETPYSPMWAPMARRYEERTAAGEPWAGWIEDVTPIFDAMGRPKPPDFVDAMNLMDPAILGGALERAGFAVHDVRTFRRHAGPDDQPDQLGAVASIRP